MHLIISNVMGIIIIFHFAYLSCHSGDVVEGNNFVIIEASFCTKGIISNRNTWVFFFKLLGNIVKYVAAFKLVFTTS